jgi:malonate decarboxylase epsilon subunit
MSVLFTFPGQGAQVPGMLHALPGQAAVADTLAEAQAVLGHDPRRLDSAEAFASTVAVQLSLLIAGVAMARVLIANGAGPAMVAGMSVGAYPAAVIAGALRFADAVRLVARRGQLMESAFPSGYGMTAVMGLERYQLEALVARVHGASTPVFIANHNAERQIVIAGAHAAMRTVAELALAQGATRCEPLAVRVPSHCALLAPAALAMRAALSATTLRRPHLTYLSSSAARAVRDPARIADDLADNMACQVNWPDTARLAWERGARLAVEMPSGNVLTALTQPVFTEGLAVCCENNRVETLVSLIARA